MNNFMNSIFGNFNNNDRRRRGGGTRSSNNNNNNNDNMFNNVMNNVFRSSNFSEEPELNPNQGPPPTAKYVLNRLKETCLNLDDINNGNKNCTICFELQHVGDLAIKLPCGHCYHKKCVWPWLLKHCTCPVCRYELTAEGGNNSNETMSRKEKSDRQRLQAERDRRKREQENELRRKRERLARLEKNETTIKRSKNSKSNNNSNKCYTNCDDGKQNPFDAFPNNDKNDADANPFDIYYDANNDDDEGVTNFTDSNAIDRSSNYSNNHYAGRDNDPVWAVVTSLSVKQLKCVIKAIGLDSSSCIDKRDLIEVLSNACYQPFLIKLSVKELTRRLKYMKLNTKDLLDKELMVQRLKDGVFDIISVQAFDGD